MPTKRIRIPKTPGAPQFIGVTDYDDRKTRYINLSWVRQVTFGHMAGFRRLMPMLDLSTGEQIAVWDEREVAELAAILKTTAAELNKPAK